MITLSIEKKLKLLSQLDIIKFGLDNEVITVRTSLDNANIQDTVRKIFRKVIPKIFNSLVPAGGFTVEYEFRPKYTKVNFINLSEHYLANHNIIISTSASNRSDIALQKRLKWTRLTNSVRNVFAYSDNMSIYYNADDPMLTLNKAIEIFKFLQDLNLIQL